MKDHTSEKEKRIKEIQTELSNLPKGNIIYKTINGKRQPYLHWTENGRQKTLFVKVKDRETMFLQIERRDFLARKLQYLQSYSLEVAELLSENPTLNRKPPVGYQYFEEIREKDLIYVDKTDFIREWWEANEQITLITRPRRFGKTLMLSTVRCFFSPQFKKQSKLFGGFKIMKNHEFRELQGTIPVLFLSLAVVKGKTMDEVMQGLRMAVSNAYAEYRFLLDEDKLEENLRDRFRKHFYGLIDDHRTDPMDALNVLKEAIYSYYGRRMLVLIDEYDTPLQEGYLSESWREISTYMRRVFQLLLKSNVYLDRALLTGITRVAKESLFSDMNNLAVYTVTSDRYSEYFGFTEQEVFEILDCQSMEEKQQVKNWYDGFTFGKTKNIYNPWSIVNYISRRAFAPYWVNSGGHGLLNHLFLFGSNELKRDLECLIRGELLQKKITENIDFQALESDPDAIWSLLLASGYVTAENTEDNEPTTCNLRITNRETLLLYTGIVEGWFKADRACYNAFCKALLADDTEAMNDYLGALLLNMCNMFDGGRHPSEQAPERFYHGLVLGLLVEMQTQYELTSNQESGYGRYDVMLRPRSKDGAGMIIEFKVRNPKREKSLEETAKNALKQISEKKYVSRLLEAGVEKEKIRKIAIVFEGKEVLVKRE